MLNIGSVTMGASANITDNVFKVFSSLQGSVKPVLPDTYFLVKHIKTGKHVPNDHKITYTKSQ
jgi:hypothetical protein